MLKFFAGPVVVGVALPCIQKKCSNECSNQNDRSRPLPTEH